MNQRDDHVVGPAPKLRRSLGLVDTVLFFVIAASNLQWVAAAAATGASSLVVWVLGCFCMFVPLSLIVVFLSARYPDEGGLYVWSKRAFGPFAGFITGWTYWASNIPYFPALLYFMAGNALFVSSNHGAWLSGSPLYFIVFSILGLAFATLLNVLGFDIEKWLNNIAALGRWLVTLILIAFGAMAWWKFGSATPFNAATLRPGAQIKDLIFLSTIAFAWTGPEAVTFIAGEIKQARQTIPRALALAAPVVGVIYIGGTVAVLSSLRPGETNGLYGVMQAISNDAGRFHLILIAPISALLVALSCLGSAGAWLGAVARLPFVAGLDRYLPKSFAWMHPRWGSPVVALLTQAIIAGVFIILGQGGTTVRGAYDVLVSTTVISTLIPFLFLFASAFVLSAGRQPQDLRVAGGRFTIVCAGALGLMTTLGAIVLAFIPSEDEANKVLAVIKIVGLTAVMVGAGIALYMAAARKRRAVMLEPQLSTRL